MMNKMKIDGWSMEVVRLHDEEKKRKKEREEESEDWGDSYTMIRSRLEELSITLG